MPNKNPRGQKLRSAPLQSGFVTLGTPFGSKERSCA
jgi:hypothetical protein